MSGPFRGSSRTADSAPPALADGPLGPLELLRAVWLGRNAHTTRMERVDVATARIVALSPRFAGVYTLNVSLLNVEAGEHLFRTTNFRGLTGLVVRGQSRLEPLDAHALGAAIGSCDLAALTDLEITACALGVAGFDALAQSRSMPALSKLSLDHARVRGGLAALATGPLGRSLRSVDVLDDAPTPEDCAALGAMPRLETLSLHRCQLDDACAEALAGTRMPSVKRLWLMENRIGNAGALAFLDAEAQFPALESLCFSGCPIDAAADRQLEECRWLEPPDRGRGLTYKRRRARGVTGDELMALARAALGSGGLLPKP